MSFLQAGDTARTYGSDKVQAYHARGMLAAERLQVRRIRSELQDRYPASCRHKGTFQQEFAQGLRSDLLRSTGGIHLLGDL